MMHHLTSRIPSLHSPPFLSVPQEHQDRVSLLYQLATMEHHPESVPINALVAVEGQLHAANMFLCALNLILSCLVLFSLCHRIAS